MAQLPDEPITREEQYLSAIAGEGTEIPEPITREEQYLAYIAENGGGGGGGTSNYNSLLNKPQINGVELKGDKSTAELKIKQIPAGGTTGQVLAKKTDTDHDVEWVDSKGSQSDTIPTASASLVGSIIQYTGATTEDYTNGFFYECVEESGSYIWVAKEVQEGGSGALETAITASINVGGIKTGDNFAVGTSYDTMWQDLLDPVQYPALTAPSATIAVSGSTLMETGATASKTFTVTFNRGSINPAYGTSGYRSGEADEYSLNGGTGQAENTFTETVSSANKTFQASVSYLAGEQPKDSKGNNYSTPLAAGSVNTNTITYEFVDALWANTSNIATIAKLALVSKSAKQKDLNFPSQTVANPEVFDVPASWTVTAVQVKNDLSGQYEDASAQFTVTDTTHDDAAGNSVNYKRYTFNLGYGTGARSVRVKWS